MSGNQRPLAEVRGGVVPRPGAIVGQTVATFVQVVKSEKLNDPGPPKFLESLDRTPEIVCFSGRFNKATGEKDDSAEWAGRVTCTACGWFALSASFTALNNMIPKRCVDSPKPPNCPVEKLQKHRASRRMA